MLRDRRPRLTYANVVATLALFVALAGTSYAAVRLPRNSIGTSQIRREAVTGAKVRSGTLTGAKIAAGSIDGSRLDLSSLGTVPSAASAAHATTAEHATLADRAGDAATLEGATAAELIGKAKPSCPAGTKLLGGVCFEEAARPPLNMFLALTACAKAGRFLPSVTMLLAFESAFYEGEPPLEWAGQSTYTPAYGSRAPIARASAEGDSITEAEDTAVAHPFRCSLMPTS
jgi:hypothetical protein